jgi:hypothetical protein
MRNRSGWILTLACVLLSSGPGRSRAQQVDQDKAEPKTLKAQVEESIKWYDVFVDAGATEPMKPQPVLRWGNFTRGKQEADGVFVLWTNHGRPEVSVGIYPWYGYITHEVVSVSRGAKLEAREEGRVVWSPKAPGVAYKDLPGAPAPAATSAGRLRQMKVLADRFQVKMTGLKADRSDREDLRMLAKPLYHAEPGKVPSPDSDWIESGVFGFVQGTDPEAILLLEAVRLGGRPRWRYAFARATAGGLEARLDQTVVWEVGFLAGQATPLKPEMTLNHPLRTTASKRGAAPAGR